MPQTGRAPEEGATAQGSSAAPPRSAAAAGDEGPAAPPPVARCLGVARNSTKADVFVIERGGGTVVRKQIARTGRGPISALGHAIGRLLLRREARMLRLLGPTGLVPRVIASGPGWLETEYIRGETVSSRRKRGITREEAARLRAALARFHESGYAHGALGRRDLLLHADGGVTILDVATAVGPGAPPLIGSALLAPLLRRRDHYRLAETIRKALEHHQAAERAARR